MYLSHFNNPNAPLYGFSENVVFLHTYLIFDKNSILLDFFCLQYKSCSGNFGKINF